MKKALLGECRIIWKKRGKNWPNILRQESNLRPLTNRANALSTDWATETRSIQTSIKPTFPPSERCCPVCERSQVRFLTRYVWSIFFSSFFNKDFLKIYIFLFFIFIIFILLTSIYLLISFFFLSFFLSFFLFYSFFYPTLFYFLSFLISFPLSFPPLGLFLIWISVLGMSIDQ